jgi:hypothetical protein
MVLPRYRTHSGVPIPLVHNDYRIGSYTSQVALTTLHSLEKNNEEGAIAYGQNTVTGTSGTFVLKTREVFLPTGLDPETMISP